MALTEEEEGAVRAIIGIYKGMSASLSDDVAGKNPGLYDKYDPDGHHYVAGDRFNYNGTLYYVREGIDHDSQKSWPPDQTPSLYGVVLVESEGQTVEWKPLPAGSPGYALGQTVTHNGKTWESGVANNVWEPGATGVGENIWKDVTEG